MLRSDNDCPTFEFVYSCRSLGSMGGRSGRAKRVGGRVFNSSGDCWGEMAKLSVYYMLANNGIVVTIAIIIIGLPSPIIMRVCIAGNKWTDGWLDLEFGLNVWAGGRGGNDCGGRSIRNPFDVNVRSINRTFRSDPLTCLASC